MANLWRCRNVWHPLLSEAGDPVWHSGTEEGRKGLQIASAHVCTYGERVVDVFYVKDVFGLKVVHPVRLQEIRHGLTEFLADLEACS